MPGPRDVNGVSCSGAKAHVKELWENFCVGHWKKRGETEKVSTIR